MHIVLAYIDPGSGSLIIQALIAGIVAAPFVLRHQISRLMRRIRGVPESEAPANSSPDADTPA